MYYLTLEMMGGTNTVNRRTVEERLQRAAYQVSRHPKFCVLAGLVYIGLSEVIDKPITAGIDRYGNRIWGRSFMGSLNDKQFMFVYLHEIVHFAMHHVFDLTDLRRHNPVLYNVAIDHVANNFIYDADPKEEFCMPLRKTDGTLLLCMDFKYKGWSVHQVFWDLMNQAKGGGKGGGGKSKDDGQGSGSIDDHDFDVKDQEADGTPMSQEKVAKIASEIQRKVDEALRQGEYLASQLGGGAPRGIGALLAAKVRWQDQMRDFAREVTQGSDETTWARRNRRFMDAEVCFPSSYSEVIGKLVIGVDTSGSIGDREINAGMAEVKAICKELNPTELHIMYWDTRVVSHEVYRKGEYDDIEHKTKPAGGGGTCVEDMADKVRGMQDVVAVIQFTDGYLFGSFGTWNVPTLWCITSNINSPVGKTIRLEV